jgi:hypothetical protein
MANKRPPDIEVTEISQNLKNSTGQGMNALFSPTPQPPVTPVEQVRKPSVPRNHGTGVPGYRGTIVLRYPEQGGKLRDDIHLTSTQTNFAH